MIFSHLLNMQSHPSWVCGLKQMIRCLSVKTMRSHPSWVCGLKPNRVIKKYNRRSHTLRGCVD